MRKLLLREVIEHIGLILGKIARTLQKIAPVFRALDAGIVSRCHRVASVFLCIVPKTGKFHAAVAQNTGVWRFTGSIACGKAVDHFFFKCGGVIQNGMGKAHHLRNVCGILCVFRRTAHGSVALAAIEPHGDTEQLTARFLQQCCRHRTVHAAAHGDQYLLTHVLHRAPTAVPHS